MRALDQETCNLLWYTKALEINSSSMLADQTSGAALWYQTLAPYVQHHQIDNTLASARMFGFEWLGGKIQCRMLCASPFTIPVLRLLEQQPATEVGEKTSQA